MSGMEPPLLDVRHLSKLYARGSQDARKRAAQVFLHVLTARRATPIGKLKASEFWALKDVNFRVKRGGAFGIIGLNGSGKTTLLRILAGQLLPDEGEVRIGGTTAALIDATAGFRMTATGRENIFLKGALMGRTRTEMEAAYDSIVEFTELGDAIDAPIASYSSGMLMRLAFAINTASEPDILLIDETLSVGDFRFRQKCLARLRELRERCCFVLVSHSMGDIKRFCTETIVLHKGQVVFQGRPDDAIERYENMELETRPAESRKSVILGPSYRNSDVVTDIEHYWCDEYGRRLEEVRSGEKLCLKVSFILTHHVEKLVLGVPVWNEQGKYVTGFSTEVTRDRFQVRRGQRATFLLEIPSLAFNPGIYLSNITVLDGAEFLIRQENPSLSVRGNGKPYWGMVSLGHRWTEVEGEARATSADKLEEMGSNEE